jgi:hypothetical protein
MGVKLGVGEEDHTGVRVGVLVGVPVFVGVRVVVDDDDEVPVPVLEAVNV